MYSIRLDTLTNQIGLRVKFRVKVLTYVFYSAGYLNTSDRVHSEG